MNNNIINENTIWNDYSAESTNNIPMCPKCNKPTYRTIGMAITTTAYYPPIYDKNGVNTNPDRNKTKTLWKCLECGNEWYEEK
jgi:ribosomal protein L37AE/L43A